MLRKPAYAAIFTAVILAGCTPNQPAAPLEHLRLTFPQAHARTSLTVPPPAEATPQILGAWRITDSSAQLLGYEIHVRTAARSGPFVVAVITDPDLTVRQLSVPEYPWQRGRAIRTAAFTGQFTGKSPASPLQPGRDIAAVSGATLSSNAATAAVRTALELLQNQM